MDKYLGKRLDGRYEITELIGSGGMANVYKAVDHLNGNTVAVKILKDELLGNEELVRRFKNESKAIGLLSHPNIVKVYDVNFSDQIQYIAMEYVDGITLKDFISSQKKLSWKDTLFFTEQILKALQHAHDRGIVHRDIKPQNIMLLSDGTIKVMDFGIARFSRSETRTITDKAIGSVHYISPEQAKGDVTAPTADIYSLGVMMYEMLTGVLPFDSDSPVQVAIKQISDTPTNPREIESSIPEALEEIVLKAMAKDPERRYQSASLMLRDIEEFKKNPSIKFEYKYFSNNTESRVAAAAAAASGAGNTKRKAQQGTQQRAQTQQNSKKAGTSQVSNRKKTKRRGIFGLAIPVMLGITLACVVGTLILVYMIFNMGENSIFSNKIDVDLPNFVGQTLEEVQNNKDYDFRFKIEYEYNATYPEGVIFQQSPNPPKTIKEDGKVTLYVSQGIEIIEIPDLIGYSNGEAVTTLQNMGLVVMIETTSNSEFKDNVVVSITPAVGSQVKTGTPVTVVINSITTSTSVRVPYLVGCTYLEAKARLNSYGLVMGGATKVDSDQPADTVLSQSIAEGTYVAQNTVVSVTVSLGPPEITNITISIGMPYSVNGSTSYTATASGAVSGSFTGGGSNTSWSFTVDQAVNGTITITADGIDIYIINVQGGGSSIQYKAPESSSVQWSKPVDPSTCEHEWGYQDNNNGTHTEICSKCHEERNTENCDHDGAGGTCSKCGHVWSPQHEHAFSYSSNGNGTHHVSCSGCDYSADEGCDGGPDGVCSKCGYQWSLGGN